MILAARRRKMMIGPAQAASRIRGALAGSLTTSIAARAAKEARSEPETPFGTGEHHRQEPLGRPNHRLIFDHSIVIGPDRPARKLRGHLFRDDLAAIADHGSPGRVS